MRVGVLPDVLTADNDTFADGLLESGVEFVSEAGASAVETPEVQFEERCENGVEQPSLERTRFSLKGVSRSSVTDAQDGG